MNPFDINPLKLVANPFVNDQMKQIAGVQEKMKAMKIMEKLYLYFDITTSSIVKRLGLMMFPFLQFSQRAAGIKLDLYLPLMGHLMYVIVSQFIRCLKVQFSTELLSRTLAYSALLFVADVVGTYVLSKTLPQQTLLDTISQTGYSFFFAGIVAPFKKLGLFFIVVLVYCCVACGVHYVQVGVARVKEHSDANLSSTAQVATQNVVVFILGALQGLVVALLVWIA